MTTYAAPSSLAGLERIAEELMGRRKWKLYQESMSRSYLQPLNNNVKLNDEISNETSVDGAKEERDRTEEKVEERICSATTAVTTNCDELITASDDREEEEAATRDKEAVEERLKDWSPQSKCYFCVEGKLDSDHNNHGGLVSLSFFFSSPFCFLHKIA